MLQEREFDDKMIKKIQVVVNQGDVAKLNILSDKFGSLFQVKKYHQFSLR